MLRLSVIRALNRINIRPEMVGWIRGKVTRSGSEVEVDPGRPAVSTEEGPRKTSSERLAAFRKKMKEDMAAAELNRYPTFPGIDESLLPWPKNTNPHTGEIGGPRGPEPTRYGDWERKGICVDF